MIYILFALFILFFYIVVASYFFMNRKLPIWIIIFVVFTLSYYFYILLGLIILGSYLTYIGLISHNEYSDVGITFGIVITYGLFELMYQKYYGYPSPIYKFLFIGDDRSTHYSSVPNPIDIPVVLEPIDIPVPESISDVLHSSFETFEISVFYSYFLVSFIFLSLLIFLFLCFPFRFNYSYIFGFDLPFSNPLSSKTILLIYIISFTLIIIGFSIIIKSTILLLLFLIVFSCFPFISNISSSNKLYPYTFPLVLWFINFLFDINFLSICKYIYDFLFSFPRYIYYTIFSFISFGCLFSLFITRYILFLKIESQAISLYIYILYIIGILFIFLRSLILFSIYIIPFVYNLSLMESHIPDDSPKPSNPRFGGIFNKHNHIHNNYFRGFPHSNFNRNLGIGVAVCGVGLSGYACYQYRLSALAAMKSADAAVKANDQWEVSNGIMTKEDYMKKYPPK
jgi:hypothetical protein